MELRQLRYFVEIARQASFTRAAETLSIAQPALTAQIHKLEAEIGASLFIRSNRGVALTDVGNATLEAAQRALDAADAAKRTAQRAAQLDGARVIIAYSRAFPVNQLARVIRGFRRERPNVELQVREMWSIQQVDALTTGAIDVGFRQLYDAERAALAERGIVSTTMSEESLLVAVPNSHPLANRRSVGLHELANESFVITTARNGETIVDRLLDEAQRAGFTPKIVQETADVRLSLGLVAAELGVSFVLSANRSVRLRNVHYLSLVPTIPVTFGVMYREGFGGRMLEPLLRRIQNEALV